MASPASGTAPTPAVHHDQLFKFIIIGDSGTGKSCLLRYFLDKKFQKGTTHTVGVEFGSKIVAIGGKQIKLQIWDTAGQERFRSVTRSYYRGAIGCLLAYDISSRESFTHLTTWLSDARQLARPDIVCIVVGNKSDRKTQREVPFAEAARFAQENDLLFMETSSVTGDCVDDVFLKCASLIRSKIESGAMILGNGVHDAARSLTNNTSTTPAATGCRC